MARKAWRAANDSTRRDRQDTTRSHRMNTNRAIRDAMVAAIPPLRRFAVALSNAQQADDLVQETLLLACDKIRLFDARSDILPWLITILRNRFYSECRKRKREV